MACICIACNHATEYGTDATVFGAHAEPSHRKRIGSHCGAYHDNILLILLAAVPCLWYSKLAAAKYAA